MLVALLASTVWAAESWFGPSNWSFEIPTAGNPYDGQENDVRVRFLGPGGTMERLAYFKNGQWHVHLVAPAEGVYRATVIRNSKPTEIRGEVRVEGRAAPFVRRDGVRLRFSDGRFYWPVGFNLGWSSESLKIWDQLPKMGNAKVNWARIWSCNWDNKNPYWPADNRKLEGRDLNESTFETWDRVVEAARKNNVYFQWVLFNHGSFSTQVNPNWQDHPWNTANGGFLKRPHDFFTDPEAIRRTRNWLRYAVARYGHEPHVLAWELFNEVEWVDPIRVDRDPTSVGEWHRTMSRYLKSLDPHDRLVTTSSEMELPIWAAADFWQPHAYPPDVAALVRSAKIAPGKPFFYGEVGGQDARDFGDGERGIVRDAIWTALLSGHHGAAQYWFWDRVDRDNLYGEFRQAREFIDRYRLADDRLPLPTRLDMVAPKGATIEVRAGRGWGPTEQTEFDLPAALESGDLGRLSSFIQGTGHRAMLPKPIQFRFQADRPGQLRVTIGSIARAGATPVIGLNNETIFEEAYPAANEDRPVQRTLTFDYPAGTNTLSVFNTGPDWFTLGSIELDGVGPTVQALGANVNRGWLMRIRRLSEEPQKFTLRGLERGAYTWVQMDLDRGDITEQSIAITETSEFIATTKDSVWLIRRR